MLDHGSIFVESQRLLAVHRCSLCTGAPPDHFYYLLLEGQLSRRLLSYLAHWLLRCVDLTLIVLRLA